MNAALYTRNAALSIAQFSVLQKFTILCNRQYNSAAIIGDVLELADRHDLGSCVERREGSTPSVPTYFIDPNGLEGL